MGKGSRQRPTAKSYQDNWQKIFGKQKEMVMSENERMEVYSEKELLLSENLRLRIENEALKVEVERLNQYNRNR